jgi:phosphomannomutase
MVLNRLAQTLDSLSKIMESLPHFVMIKDKLELKSQNVCLPEPTAIFDKAKVLFKDAEMNTVDGLKFIWDNKWMHLRASNTEPIIRLYAEAPTESEAKILIKKLKNA